MKKLQAHTGKRRFTISKIPVSSILGRRVIFGESSDDVIAVVRGMAIDGKPSKKVPLKLEPETEKP